MDWETTKKSNNEIILNTSRAPGTLNPLAFCPFTIKWLWRDWFDSLPPLPLNNTNIIIFEILPWDRLHRPTVRFADTNREELHWWYEQWTTNVGTIYSQDTNTKVKQTMLVDEERIDSLECERLQPALHESDLVLVVMNLTAKKYITFSLSFVLKIPKNISSTLRRALRKSIVSVTVLSTLLSVLKIFLGILSTNQSIIKHYNFTMQYIQWRWRWRMAGRCRVTSECARSLPDARVQTGRRTCYGSHQRMVDPTPRLSHNHLQYYAYQQDALQEDGREESILHP